MTKDEALKLALEALEKDPAPLNAINNAKCFLYSALEQPEQEPVAWMTNSEQDVTAEYTFSWCKTPTHDIPLYTAPPKREWVGLTDEEKWSIFTSKDWTGKPLSLIDAVLTAYEEKNRE